MNTISQYQEFADNAILIYTDLSELRSYEAIDGTQVFRLDHAEDL